jgi:hypothetical protein
MCIYRVGMTEFSDESTFQDLDITNLYGLLHTLRIPVTGGLAFLAGFVRTSEDGR